MTTLEAEAADRTEQSRIEALRRYGVLDAPTDRDFEDIVTMAAAVCGTSVAAISLADAHRQWFLAEQGLGCREAPANPTFWARAVSAEDIVVVPDALRDPSLANDALVSGSPHLRFYAGLPLRTADGLAVGMLFVADQGPKHIDDQQAGLLRMLARTVMMRLEARGEVNDLRLADRHHRDAEARNRQILASAIDYAIISFSPDGRIASWNEGAHRILGWDEAEAVGQDVGLFFTPEDVEAGVAASEMNAALLSGRGTDERWHQRKGGERFWASGEVMALRDDAGLTTGFIKILRDRTEHRLAEERFRHHRHRLETAMATGLVGFFTLDVAARTIAGDARFLYFHGLPHLNPGEDVSLDMLSQMIDPIERDDILAHIRTAIMGMRDYSLQVPLVHPDGGRHWSLISARCFEQSEGRAVRYTGIAVDITATKQSERALMVGGLRQSALIELGDQLRDLRSPEAVIEASQAMLGRVLGIDRMMLVSVDDHSSSDGRVARHRLTDFGAAGADLRAGQVLAIEDIATDARFDAAAWPDNDALLAVPIIENAGLVGAVAVVQKGPRAWTVEEIDFVRGTADRVWAALRQLRANADLRALNQTLEVQLAARKRERDRIWNVSHDMMGVADLRGVWLSINPAWQAVLGWAEDEIVGRSSEWMEHPDDVGAMRAETDGLAEQPRPLSFENRLRNRDGTYRWLSWTAVPEDGLLYCVIRDVTVEKERDHELAQTHEALRQAQKMEAVGQLTGGVAHDFNNLLTIIRSSVDFLRLRELPEARRRRYVDAISDTVDRAAKLTGQLLAFARRQPLRPEIFDVGHQVTAVAEMVRSLVGARIAIDVQLPDPVCFTEADIGQFETALVNLAINARDAMNGEGRLFFAVQSVSRVPPIRGHLGGPGDFVTVSVGDTGCGIGSDQIERIFEPFFTTKEVGKGTGLGLSQVFGFVKQSGGEIDVTSEPGRGAVFTLYLPRVSQAVPAQADLAGSTEPGSSGQGSSVLVVEDNQAVGAFSTQMLQDLGYSTTWAANADEALSLLGENHKRFDVVFSDVVMPGMSGVELGQIIRQRYPALPVILTSGYSHVLAEEGRHGFELLQKPYSVEAMSRILRRVIGKRPGRRPA